MSKFKVGDTVVRLKTSFTRNVKKGDVAIVLSVTGTLLNVKDHTGTYKTSCDFWKVKTTKDKSEDTIMEEKNIETKTKNQWNFIVPDHSFINYSMIAQDLSYSNPIIWIESTDSEGEVVTEIMVDVKLLDKSDINGVTNPFSSKKPVAKKKNQFEVYKTTEKLHTFVKWARLIKQLPWKGSVKEQVKVLAPKV